TRLALRLARTRATAFAHGAWLVDLSGLSDPALVPTEVARVMGIGDQTRHGALEALVEWLRPRQALLLLDNCERVVDIVAALTIGLLRVCSDLQVLVTSREPLGIDGEIVWRVQPLRLPRSESDTLREAQASDAVRLFVARASTRSASFVLNERNASAVVDVC